MSARKPLSPDKNSIDDALVLVSHQHPFRQSKLPALRDTPRSSFGSTTSQLAARPKVHCRSGFTRQVPDSYITISSTSKAPVISAALRTIGGLRPVSQS